MMNIMKEAHRLTREIKERFADVDYKTQLGLCMSYLYEEMKKEAKTERVDITKYEDDKTKYEIAKALNSFEEHEDYAEINEIIIRSLTRALDEEYVTFNYRCADINKSKEFFDEIKNGKIEEDDSTRRLLKSFNSKLYWLHEYVCATMEYVMPEIYEEDCKKLINARKEIFRRMMKEQRMTKTA